MFLVWCGSEYRIWNVYVYQEKEKTRPCHNNYGLWFEVNLIALLKQIKKKKIKKIESIVYTYIDTRIISLYIELDLKIVGCYDIFTNRRKGE